MYKQKSRLHSGHGGARGSQNYRRGGGEGALTDRKRGPRCSLRSPAPLSLVFPALGPRKGLRGGGPCSATTSWVTLGTHSPLWGFVPPNKWEGEALLRGSWPLASVDSGQEPSQTARSIPGRRRPRARALHLTLLASRRHGLFRPAPSPGRPRAPSPLPPAPRLGRPLTGQAPQLQEPPARSAERAGHRRHLGSGHASDVSATTSALTLRGNPRLSREARARSRRLRRSGEGVPGTR